MIFKKIPFKNYSKFYKLWIHNHPNQCQKRILSEIPRQNDTFKPSALQVIISSYSAAFCQGLLEADRKPKTPAWVIFCHCARDPWVNWRGKPLACCCYCQSQLSVGCRSMVSDFYDAILATRNDCGNNANRVPGPLRWRGLKDVIPEWPRGTKRGPADRMLAASGEAEKVEIFFRGDQRRRLTRGGGGRRNNITVT